MDNCGIKLTVLLVVYAMSGNEMRASVIFSALAVFQSVRLFVSMAGVSLRLVLHMKLVLSRATKFLQLEACYDRTHGDELAATNDLTISIGSFTLDVGSRVLVRPASMTAVCGPVGSGKSLLLRSILGLTDGAVRGCARTAAIGIGWAPQKPIILSGTVRENILLGRTENLSQLAAAVADACLDQDVLQMSQGLDTVVGDRGITLSGGQQARLGLARAYYGEPPLLVLDDPLAAVDSAVCRQLFHRLLSRCRRGAGVIVVLNQVGLVSHFDDVVVLASNGTVRAHGNPEEIRKQRLTVTRDVIDIHLGSADFAEAGHSY